MSTQAGSPTSRPWLIALPTAVLVLLGVLWSGFWYWSSTKAESSVTVWRAHEADAGRIYACGDAAFGGYPFRLEASCAEPSLEDRRNALSLRARNLKAVAQVWDPTLVIGEIAGPLTVAPRDGSPTAAIDWTLAQASLRGGPGAPERLSVVVNNPSLASIPQSGGPLAKAGHLEIHGRLSAEATPGHPAVDLALDLKDFTAPGLVATLGTFGPIAAAPTDVSIVAVLRSGGDLAPRSLAQWLRDLQAAGGRFDITNARVQQGDLIAVGSGTLGLTARGTLSGDLQLTVANFARLIPMLGIDRAVAQFVPPDTANRIAPALNRFLPGLGNMLRGGNSASGDGASGKGTATANASAAALGAAAVGGRQTELEGQQAVIVKLRFDDGAAFLGPLKIGQIPPLF